MDAYYLSLIVPLAAIFSGTIGSTSNPAAALSIEDSILYLTERMTDLSIKLQELQQWTLDQKEAFKRVTDVERMCEESTADVAGKLESAENRFLKIDTYLLMEVQQLKTKSSEILETVRDERRDFATTLERERLQTHTFQEKLNEIASQLHSADIKNMSSLVENLRLEVNNNLTSGFEKIQSNFTTKMRTIENSVLKFEKDYGNLSYVSTLDKSLQNQDKSAKSEYRTSQNDLSSRVSLLEQKSALCDCVQEMNKTLRNHTSQINGLNQQLLEVKKSCATEPPSVRNGKPMDFERMSGSVVQYECDRNFILARNSSVQCKLGKWEGQPPFCSFFDATLTFVVDPPQMNFICYSDYNYEKIKISRILGSQSGGDLPSGVTTTVRNKSVVINFSQVSSQELCGAYECGIQVDGSSARIVSGWQTLAIHFPKPTKLANNGDTVDLELKQGWVAEFQPIRWKHNGEPVPSWDGKQNVTIQNVQLADAGIYESYGHGTASTHFAVMNLIVRKCKEFLYGEQCDKECPACYNGGVCHDLLGICVCPPGFAGKNCEVACGENRFGADCSKTCPRSSCKGSTFCMPDPYGCTCAPGLSGLQCVIPCEPGWYGAECKQPCHCASGPKSCSIYTGACSGGCSPGWTGESCQIKV